MAKLVVKQPGFFVTIPGMGSFRSPFKVKIEESIRPLVEIELLKNGIKNFKILSDEEKNPKTIEQPKKETNVDMSEVLRRLDNIQILINKVLDSKISIRRVKGEPLIIENPEIEEDIFIPTISNKTSVVDLSVKTTEKDDISSRVDLLSSLKK